jgi:hypothetical protein
LTFGEIMKLRLTSILIAVLALSGCDQKSPLGSPANEKTTDELRTAAAAKELNPVFQAEIVLESRSPDRGVISFSLTLEETGLGGQDKAQKSWTDFNLHGGSVCKIYPTFIEHRKGYDVWRMKLKYVASEESDDTLRAAVSKEIVFDGKSPVVVTKDEHHSIVVRPATKTGSEQGGADQAATAPGTKSEGIEEPNSESEARPQFGRYSPIANEDEEADALTIGSTVQGFRWRSTPAG